jgi:ABC-type antimicrobial peptide transport system permease subunit
MIENAVILILAVVVSFGISHLLIPAYNALMGDELIQIDKLSNSVIITFATLLIIIVTLLSGAYPAFYISKFSSLAIFKNKVVLSGKNRLMTILLTFQFGLCFYNLFTLVLDVDNAHYQETLDRGYTTNEVINIPLRSDQFEVLRDQLIQRPDVVEIAGSNQLIGLRSTEESLKYNGDDYTVTTLKIGVKYLETLGVRLHQGALFNNKEGSVNEVVINKMLGDKIGVDILHKTLNIEGGLYKVIGIVDNFNTRSIMMDNKIKPTVLKLALPDDYKYLSVQFNQSPLAVKSSIEKLWYDLFPRELYKGFLQEYVLKNMRDTNNAMIQIHIFLSVISILISILGLFTLISLTVQRRTKEFGIRKVLGASNLVIINLIGLDLYWILGIAAILGLSSAAYVLNIIFDIIFSYHIAVGIIHFVLPILFILGVVILTVGVKVYQAGRMNPSEQLRTE